MRATAGVTPRFPIGLGLAVAHERDRGPRTERSAAANMVTGRGASGNIG